MTFVGVDPGLGGAVALIRSDGSVRIFDTPTIRVPKKSARGKTRVQTLYDLSGMLRVLDEIELDAAIDLCAIEQLQAMPAIRGKPKEGQPDDAVVWAGASVSFHQGRGMGLWEMALTARQIPFLTVLPQVWKRAMMLGFSTKEKAAAVLAADRLFPKASALLRGPKGGVLHDRGDALLLAGYAQRLRRVPSEESVTFR